MNDPFADAFREMAEDGARIPIEECVKALTDHFAQFRDEEGRDPDVLILVHSPEGMVWQHNGITHERAVFILARAQQIVLFPDGDD